MEELMPELVGLVLSQVDRPSLVACRFVCTTWMRTTSPPQDLKQQQHDYEEDWSKQFAALGWLGVLQWAQANGCPWGEATCLSAAGGGHLEVLQWARTNGCPWDSSTCAHAAVTPVRRPKGGGPRHPPSPMCRLCDQSETDLTPL
jgi:hypothetical protein